MNTPNDTSPEAERVLIEAYRKMSFDQKWRQMGAIYRTARALHAAGMRYRNPSVSDEDIRRDWMRTTLGEALFREVTDAMRARREAVT
jgi:hypothetical protein